MFTCMSMLPIISAMVHNTVTLHYMAASHISTQALAATSPMLVSCANASPAGSQ